MATNIPFPTIISIGRLRNFKTVVNPSMALRQIEKNLKSAKARPSSRRTKSRFFFCFVFAFSSHISLVSNELQTRQRSVLQIVDDSDRSPTIPHGVPIVGSVCCAFRMA